MGAIKLNCSPATSFQPLLAIWKTNQFSHLATMMFLMHTVTVLQIAGLIHKPCFSFSLFSIFMDSKDNLHLG